MNAQQRSVEFAARRLRSIRIQAKYSLAEFTPEKRVKVGELRIMLQKLCNFLKDAK
jgi:hypothetical protein